MKTCYLVIDCGTTNLRVTLLDENKKKLDTVKAEGGVRHTSIDGHNGRLRTMLRESIETVLGFSFATSMPMAFVPGNVTTRTPLAANESCISSSSLFICATLTPGAGTISYSVTVGPTLAEIFVTPIL